MLNGQFRLKSKKHISKFKIYPDSNFLHKRFKFDKAGCAFCDFTDESLEHLFFTCPISCQFWSDVRDWLTLKMSNIPVFNINHILLYVDGLDNSISDILNIVFLLAKYHIHFCKWRDSRPCFEHFINEFNIFYSSLRLLKFRAPKISSDISKFLVFFFALHVLWIPLRFYTECYCIWFYSMLLPLWVIVFYSV